ncbi:Trim28 [Symbiodinium sp. CCMP2592]|nr:Trim28 [Symbiodinium sp. CCMP2592]
MSLQESFRQSNSPGQEACSPSRYFEEDTYPSSPRDAEFERQAAPPSTGRQSQELLREMRRLRQQMEQMAELEKLAAGRDPGGRGPRLAVFVRQAHLWLDV